MTDEEKKMEPETLFNQTNRAMEKDEIDLLEVTRKLLRCWKLILISTVLCFCAALLHALTTEDSFRAEVLLASSDTQNPPPSPIFGQFGGLASMAGISIPGDNNLARVLATMQSKQFLTKYIEKKDLLPLLFVDLWDKDKKKWKITAGNQPPSVETGSNMLCSAIQIEDNTKNGLVSLSVSWNYPELPAFLANDLVRELNEQLRFKAIEVSRKRVVYLEQELAKTSLKDMRDVLYSLLESEKQKAMLANVNEDFALEIIDPASIPKQAYKPKRVLIVTIGAIGGLLLGFLLVFVSEFIHNLRLSNLADS